MKVAALSALFLSLLSVVSSALPYVGMYQTIDDKSGAPKSIVALYEYADGDDVVLAGRIVALYGADGTVSETLSNPVRIADKIKGAPKYVGLDIIWDMDWDSDDAKYEDGKIMDPTSGSVYSSVAWQDVPGTLNVRGKLGPFGRTQTWNLLSNDALPAELKDIDTANWKPIIRK